MFCSTGSEVNMHIFLFRNCVHAFTIWEANKLPVAKKRVSLQLLKNCLFTLNYRVMPLLFAFHSSNITPQHVVDTESRNEIWWSPFIKDLWIARMPADQAWRTITGVDEWNKMSRPRWSRGYHTRLWIRGSRVRSWPGSLKYWVWLPSEGK